MKELIKKNESQVGNPEVINTKKPSLNETFVEAGLLRLSDDNYITIKPGTQINGYDANEIMILGPNSLYHSFQPADAVESTLALLVVANMTTVMDCSAEAKNNRGTPAVREINLKYMLKASEVTERLLDALARYRGKTARPVVVGNVNVESGGRAIVGHVETHGERESSESKA